MVHVKFHDIGEGITEGEILSYFVRVGDQVKIDQPLVELQTDKMVAEIPSPAAGTIKAIHFEPGKSITVGSLIMEIDNGVADQPSRVEIIDQHPKQPPIIKGPNRVIASPLIRKIARQHEVDINQINGTGPRGRITANDIHRVHNNKQMQAITQTAKASSNATIPRKESEGPIDIIPFQGIRKQIAKNMTRSISTIPHVTHFDEVDVTPILEIREALKNCGENISIIAFFLKALALALKDYRVFNAQLDEEREVIQLHPQFNIGLATDTTKGLVVPVLHDVNRKNVRQIQLEMKALTKRAQNGELTPADMRHGTFTISNVGPLGGIAATPIINYPQTGIIAFHKMKKKPVVMPNEVIAVRSIMTLSFSFDHRVADGATAIAFTNRFTELIEEPGKLLVELI